VLARTFSNAGEPLPFAANKVRASAHPTSDAQRMTAAVRQVEKE